MKGNNELHINQSTMLEAVNLWLASTFKVPPKAVDVSRNAKVSSGADCFIIKVSEPEESK